VPFVLTLMNSTSNVVELLLLSLELDAKIQSPLKSHAISLAMEYRIAWEAAESFAAGAVLPLLIICGIIVVLLITSLLVSAIVGISILFILPDKIRVVSSSSSSPLFSSWPNDVIVRPDMEASNAISTIDRVLAAIVEEAVVLRQMLDMKKDG
jgi:hypothetical protein